MPASLCHFGHSGCPGQVPRAGWGPHQLPHPQARSSAHCPAMLLCQLECASPARPLPFLQLACPPSPCPFPLSIILRSHSSRKPSLLPQVSIPVSEGPQGSRQGLYASLLAPVEYLGWSQLYPVQSPSTGQDYPGASATSNPTLHGPFLGSEGPGCGTSILSPTHFFNPLHSRPVLCKVSAGDKGLTCTRP